MSEVRAKKALGQHFLVDLNIARKICDSLGGGTSEKPCPVLEVGCGMGVLTRFLLKRTDVVTYGAEIDSESVAYLHAHYPEFTPRLMEGDFLKMDLRTLFPEGLRVIGNFPYNISSQIFFKVLENRDLIPECVGMIQKEVAVRLAEPPGSKEYGILSALLQAWYDIEYRFGDLFAARFDIADEVDDVDDAGCLRAGLAGCGCGDASAAKCEQE